MDVSSKTRCGVTITALGSGSDVCVCGSGGEARGEEGIGRAGKAEREPELMGEGGGHAVSL